MRLLNIALLILLSWVAYSQKGSVTIKQSTDGIELKWYDQDLVHYNGVDVWRKEGDGDWIKLTSSKILPGAMPGVENEEVAFVNELVKTKKSIEGITLLNAMLSSFKYQQSAEILGIYYFDHTVKKGNSYRYKVTEANEKEIALSSSEKYTGEFEVVTPTEFNVKSNKRKAKFYWSLSPLEYFGVNLYAKVNGVDQKMNDLPIISGNTSGDTSLQYQYEMELEEKTTYQFYIKAIGFFSDESQPSEVFEVNIGDYTPPSQPKGLSYEQSGLNNVHLKWMKYDDESASELAIYRGSRIEEMALQEKLTGTAETAYTDHPQPGDHYYAIGALDEAGNQNLSNPILVHVEDMVAPAIPEGLIATADTGWVHLNWNPVSSSDLKGYQLYRSGAGDKDFKLLNAEVITETAYSFQTSKRTKSEMVFYVTAIDSALNRSEPSATVSISQKDVIPPAAPLLKNVWSSDTTIVLKWLPNTESDLSYYEVYRKEEKDTAYIKLAEVSSSEENYLDDQIQSGKRYQYKIAAFDKALNGSKSSNVFTVDAPLLARSESFLKVKWKLKKKKGQVKVVLDEPAAYKGCIILAKTDKGDWQSISGLKPASKFTIFELAKYEVIKIKAYDNKGGRYISEELQLTTKN